MQGTTKAKGYKGGVLYYYYAVVPLAERRLAASLSHGGVWRRLLQLRLVRHAALIPLLFQLPLRKKRHGTA